MLKTGPLTVVFVCGFVSGGTGSKSILMCGFHRVWNVLDLLTISVVMAFRCS
jgi:hypothetical protein